MINKISFYKSWYLILLSVLSTATLGIIGLRGKKAFAQSNIVPDDTLGNEKSLILPLDGNGAIDTIRGGAVRGSNLFHSFQEFNVGTERGVYFISPSVEIQNILTRVSGNNPSEILGTLGTIGGSQPNLFLINPNGIVFGENVSLDLQGSFTATTADGIKLGEDNFFSASEPQQSSLLSVEPGALFFNQVAAQPGNIVNRGNLAVGNDFTIAADNLDLQGQLLAGGDLKLQGTDTVKIRDNVANPFIAAAKGKLLVQGNQSVDIFALSNPDSGLFSGGDMVLRSRNQVAGDAKYWSGGSFRIEQLDGSLGDLFSPYDPVIWSLGDVSINDYVGASLHILAGGSVNIGTARIIGADSEGNSISSTTTPNLANVTLSDGTQLVINGNTTPTLDVRAGMKPEAIGIPLGINGDNLSKFVIDNIAFSFVEENVKDNLDLNPVPTSANITVGKIDMSAANGLVLLTNQYKPNKSLTGGDITISGGGIDTNSSSSNASFVFLDSRNNIELIGSSINSSSDTGNGGNITLISAKDIILKPDDSSSSTSFLDTSSSGIDINSLLGFFSPDAISQFFDSGNGGDITLNALGNIIIDDAKISSFSNQGNGGDIKLNAVGDININNDTSFKTVSAGKGNITIEGSNVNISNSEITAGINSQSQDASNQAGNIAIDSSGNVIIENSLISNTQESNSSNTQPVNSGNIIVNAKSLSLINGGVLDVSSTSQGNAGNINIEVSDTLTIDGISGNNQPSDENTGNVNNGTNNFANNASLTPNLLSLQGNSRNLNTGISNSIINTSFTANLLSLQGNAGNFNIRTNDTFTIQNLITNNIRLPGIILIAGNLEINPPLQPGFGILEEAQPRQQEGIQISSINSFVAQGIRGNSGNIHIKAGSLSVTNGGQINANNFGKGNAGNINLDISDAVNLSGTNTWRTFQQGRELTFLLNSAIVSQIGQEAEGNPGYIDINANSLSMADLAEISTSIFGEGNITEIPNNTFGEKNPGNIFIKVKDNISLTNQSAIRSVIETAGKGNSGNIDIETRSLNLRNGGQLATGIFQSIGKLFGGEGKGGNITVKASEEVNISGVSSVKFPFFASNPVEQSSLLPTEGLSSGLLTITEIGASGTAGNITVDTKNFQISDGGVVNAKTENPGDGGNITINTNTFAAKNGGQILTTTFDSGKAGNITINATDRINLTGSDSTQPERLERLGGNIVANDVPFSGVFANTGANSTTEGGNINLDTKNLNITDEAQISAQSQGSGEAGDININLDNILQAENGEITTNSEKSSGGVIDIEAKNIRLFGNSNIRTDVANGEGGGGNITLTSNTIVALDESDIFSFASDGKGGDISFNTKGFFSTPLYTPTPQIADAATINLLDKDSKVDLNASGAVSGAITGVPDITFIENSLSDLQQNPIDTNALIANSCIARSRKQESTFNITGAGGLPQRPGDAAASNYPTGEVQNLSDKIQSSQWKPGEAIVEPQGVYELPSGKLILSRECD